MELILTLNLKLGLYSLSFLSYQGPLQMNQIFSLQGILKSHSLISYSFIYLFKKEKAQVQKSFSEFLKLTQLISSRSKTVF